MAAKSFWFETVAAPRWLGRGRAPDRQRRPHHRHRSRPAPGRRRGARHRRPRPLQRPQPCLSARHGGPCRARRAGRRRLLVVARGHVPLSRPHGPGRGRSHHRAGLFGNAGGRLHPRRRVPLSPQCPRWQRLCRPGGNGGAHRRGGGRDGHRADPAAGVLRPWRFRRCAAQARPAAVPARCRRLCADLRGESRRCCRATPISASRRTACAP